MSKCISKHGEYSEHDPYGPDDLAGPSPFVCARCYVFDEDAALERIDVLEGLLTKAAGALKAVGKAAIVVKPTLSKPYPDEPSWSPWKRFMEEPARAAYNLGVEIRRSVGSSDRGSVREDNP